MITFLIGIAILIGGYFTYGKFVERIFGPDNRNTPAVQNPDVMRAVGYEIRDLKRVSYCKIQLGELPAGEYRELTADEMNKLRQAVRMK